MTVKDLEVLRHYLYVHLKDVYNIDKTLMYVRIIKMIRNKPKDKSKLIVDTIEKMKDFFNIDKNIVERLINVLTPFLDTLYENTPENFIDSVLKVSKKNYLVILYKYIKSLPWYKTYEIFFKLFIYPIFDVLRELNNFKKDFDCSNWGKYYDSVFRYNNMKAEMIRNIIFSIDQKIKEYAISDVRHMDRRKTTSI